MTTTDTRDPVQRWHDGIERIRDRERRGLPVPESWYEAAMGAAYDRAAAWETARQLRQAPLLPEQTGGRYR